MRLDSLIWYVPLCLYLCLDHTHLDVPFPSMQVPVQIALPQEGNAEDVALPGYPNRYPATPMPTATPGTKQKPVRSVCLNAPADSESQRETKAERTEEPRARVRLAARTPWTLRAA